MGDETTWGDLRRLLLIHRNNDPQDRVKAWRFDYYSKDVSFRKTAWLLAATISRIKRATNQPAVNVVAHSFGGILTRTYLQGMASADGTGNPAGPFLAYQGNVNKLMTLGTPHHGIGNQFSRLLADICANESGGQGFVWPTCFEAATGLFETQGKGAFLRALNFLPLPPLESLEYPQYHVIIGQRFNNGVRGDGLAGDDGLITTAGADICAAFGRPCNPNQISVRIYARSASETFALCHTDIGPIGIGPIG
ncbi:MAG: hypothetical protein ABL983_23625, partial [Nitrospira sp.]